MADNNIYIKERSKAFYLKGGFYLAMIVLSLWFAFQPFYSTAYTDASAGRFYLIGGIVCTIFSALFAYLLVKELKPDNAFTLNAKGFTDKNNIGKETVVEWTNVESVKLLESDDAHFLGINLVNVDIVASKMKKKQIKAMRENIEDGLPAIIVSQDDVRVSIDSLKNTFSRFVREARTLDTDTTTKKQKVNPFSTDDVLRAFGQLPKEDGASDKAADTAPKTATTVADDKSTEEKDAFIEALIGDIKSIESVEEATDTVSDADTVNKDADSEAEDAKADLKTEDATADDEIQALLSRTKSSRISELEKMLAGDDTDTAGEPNSGTAVSPTASKTDEDDSDESDSTPVILATDDTGISDTPHSDSDETLDSSFRMSLRELSESFSKEDSSSDASAGSSAVSNTISLQDTARSDDDRLPDLVLITDVDDEFKTGVSDDDDQISFITGIDEDDE